MDHKKQIIIRMKVLFERILFPLFLLILPLYNFLAFIPKMPDTRLDPAWKLGISYAVSNGLIFGEDLVFTFGPFAGIIMDSYHPDTEFLLQCTGFFLSLCFFLLFWITFRHKDLPTKLLMVIAVIFLFSVKTDGIILSYLLLTGVNLLKWLNQAPKGKYSYMLFPLLTFPFGLIVLIKGTFLLFTLVVISLAFIYACIQKRWFFAALIAMSPIISVLFFWQLAGQPLYAVFSFFKALAPVVSGYSEAMGGKANTTVELLIYTGISLFILGIIIREKRLTTLNKIMHLLLFSAMLFISFKAGFVGGGNHKFYGALPLIFITFILYSEFQHKITAIPILASLFLWLFMVTPTKDISKINSILQFFQLSYYSSGINSVNQRINHPELLKKAYYEKLDSIQQLVNLPKLSGTTDIFPHHQTHLIASGNTWHPRPVFQSYCAYNTTLAEKNTRFLKSSKSPDHIFWGIAPLRKRFPSLDDGSTWPILLAHYQLNGYYNGFLHLKKRRSEDRLSPKLTLHSTKTATLGEEVSIPEIRGKLIYAKVNVEKTLFGHFYNFLYRAPQIDLALKMNSGEIKPYKFIPAMGKSFFLVSPLIEKTEAFGMLYRSSHLLESLRPKAFLLAYENKIKTWRISYLVDFYTADFPTPSNEFNFVNVFQPIDSLGKINFTKDCPCQGNLELPTRGREKNSTYAQHDGFFNYQGWLAKAPKKGMLADNVLVILTDDRGKRLFLQPQRILRENVGKYFNQPNMVHAGFTVKADVSRLKGTYIMELGYLENDSLCICPSTSRKIHFSPTLFED
jgi:hypothetical protein